MSDLEFLDHLVLATPDLAGAVADFAARTGVAPVPGGSHPGFGTANWLVGLGGSAYLEIVGPDPTQPAPPGPRPFGIDDLARTALVTWAVRPPDIDGVIAHARGAGYDPGDASPMSRDTPSGETLRWRLTPAHDVVPFLIDWGDTPHPTTRDLPTVALTSLVLSHPDPLLVSRHLHALGVLAPVAVADRPTLSAVLATPRGEVTLDESYGSGADSASRRGRT